VGERIGVPLELDDMEVVGSEIRGGVLEVEVRSTFPAACFHCGSMSVVGHGRFLRRIRDRRCAYPTVLCWDQRRFLCQDCGRTSRERHPAIPERRCVTHRYRRQLFEAASRRPFTEVAAVEAVSFYRVVEAFDALAPADASPGAPRVLSLDESSFRRPFVFHTVISDPVAGRVLHLGDGRDQPGAIRALLSLPRSVRAGVETVVIDCHWPYRRAVDMVMPHARVVADKFHVLRSVQEAAQKVRRRHGNKRHYEGRDGGTARQHHPRNDPRVYRARWTFLKRADALTDWQRDQLEALFALYPQVGVAWWLRETFAAIYDAPDRPEAERRLDVWLHHVEVAGIKEFSDTWRSLQWWREPILAYFDDRLTNAFAEGITNKIKVTKRAAYGFRNPDRYRRKVLLVCDRRPCW
jgi:transposase